jgi:uncharacterized protein YfaS (alpha-2-macroglobulin family)
VEDHLPGGFEALNENLNITPHVYALDEYDYYFPFFWEELGYNYKQIHGDRISFFVTDLEKGSHLYTYMARAILSGEFLALPAEVSAMYDLDTWGRSRSDWIIIH